MSLADDGTEIKITEIRCIGYIHEDAIDLGIPGDGFTDLPVVYGHDGDVCIFQVAGVVRSFQQADIGMELRQRPDRGTDLRGYNRYRRRRRVLYYRLQFFQTYVAAAYNEQAQ